MKKSPIALYNAKDDVTDMFNPKNMVKPLADQLSEDIGHKQEERSKTQAVLFLKPLSHV